MMFSIWEFANVVIIGMLTIIPLKKIIINIQAILISHFVNGSIICIFSKLVITDSLLWFEENICDIKSISYIKISKEVYQEYFIQ